MATAGTKVPISPFDANVPSEIAGVLSTAGDALAAFPEAAAAVKVISIVLSIIGALTDSSDDIKAEFVALSQHLDAIAGTLSWQISETERENRLGDLIADVIAAGEALKSNTPISVNSPLAVNSLQDVSQAEQPISFQRYFVEAVTGPPCSGIYDCWKGIIPDRPDHPNNFVYDWRLGVPALVLLLSYRIQIVAAIDPNFLTDTVFQDEMVLHRNALRTQYQKMIAGVRCNDVPVPPVPPDGTGPGDANWHYFVACADIHTGINEVGRLDFGNAWPLDVSSCQSCIDTGDGLSCTWDQACLDRAGSDYRVWYSKQVQPTLTQFRQDVLAKLPLTQLQKSIGALNLYAQNLSGPLDMNSYCANIYGNGSTAVRHWHGRDRAWYCAVGATQHVADLAQACADQFGSGYSAQVDMAGNPSCSR